MGLEEDRHGWLESCAGSGIADLVDLEELTGTPVLA
jgi:hypothetical protein